MYKYEVDPARNVGATERTRDAGRMDRRTDGRMEWNQYTPQQLRCAEGIMLAYSTNACMCHLALMSYQIEIKAWAK